MCRAFIKLTEQHLCTNISLHILYFTLDTVIVWQRMWYNIPKVFKSINISYIWVAITHQWKISTDHHLTFPWRKKLEWWMAKLRQWRRESGMGLEFLAVKHSEMVFENGYQEAYSQSFWFPLSYSRFHSRNWCIVKTIPISVLFPWTHSHSFPFLFPSGQEQHC